MHVIVCRPAVRRLAAVVLALPVAMVSIPGPAEGESLPQVAAAPPTTTDATTARAKPLLPNLTPLRATDMYVQRDQHTRRLRFEAGLANVGVGPMEVRPNNTKPCPKGKRHATQVVYRDVDGSGHYKRSVDQRLSRRSSGCMVFHPQHNHWHFEAASRYRLYRPGAENHIVVRARKMSFCLRDSERVPANFGEFRYPVYYRDCARNTPQGISIGWVDVYANYLAGQALTLPRRVKHGRYCLNIRVDPRDELWEGDETDNNSYRAFRLHGTKIRLIERNRICKPE